MDYRTILHCFKGFMNIHNLRQVLTNYVYHFLFGLNTIFFKFTVLFKMFYSHTMKAKIH